MDEKDIERAREFARQAHEGQNRKSTAIPYIEHPLAVADLVKEMGADPDVIIAALLHDTTEDTRVTLDQIVEEFGTRVAGIVAGTSEPDKSLSWEDRKTHTIETLRSASFEAAMVSAADKIDNLRSTADEISRIGDEVWKRFNRGRDQQEWYHREALKSLRANPSEIRTHKILDLFEEEIERVFGSRS